MVEYLLTEEISMGYSKIETILYVLILPRIHYISDMIVYHGLNVIANYPDVDLNYESFYEVIKE